MKEKFIRPNPAKVEKKRLRRLEIVKDNLRANRSLQKRLKNRLLELYEEQQQYENEMMALRGWQDG